MRLGGHPQLVLGSPAWARDGEDFLFHKVPLGSWGLSQDIPSPSEEEEPQQQGWQLTPGPWPLREAGKERGFGDRPAMERPPPFHKYGTLGQGSPC